DSFSGGGDFMARPAMRELLSYIDKNPTQKYVVIFDDLKRFARDTKFHIQLRLEFKARDVSVHCLNFKFEDTPEGNFVETIMAASNELERLQNRRQVMQKQKARLEAGYWTFFHPPGYVAKKVPGHGKVLFPKNPEAKILKEALEGYASNRFMQLTDVLKFLIRKRFIKNDGKNHLQRVIELFKRAAIYAGYIEYLPWEVSRREGHHKSLISRECLVKIEDKMAGKVKNPIREDISSDFPLRGFLICANCNQNFTASWSTSHTGNKYPYYRCKTNGCLYKNKSINRETVDERFKKLIKEVKPKPQLIDFLKSRLLAKWNKAKENVADISRNIGNKVLEFKAEIKRLVEKKVLEFKAEIKRLVELASRADNRDMVKAYEEEITEFKQKERISRLKIEELNNGQINFGTALNAVLEIIKNPYKEWETGDLLHRKLVLKMVFGGNLKYDRIEGFGTLDLALPIRVFGRTDLVNSPDVDMGRVELPCK
ncbi:MAG: recombinase family protein, partial [Candidatus Vogelbacteria bacterium]|nr:recombinase family protein [Candidatus Vogelbacteria bacterium]